MPILLMALLALLVFGLVGILLTVATLLEHSKLARSTKSSAAVSVPCGSVASLHPKL